MDAFLRLHDFSDARFAPLEAPYGSVVSRDVIRAVLAPETYGHSYIRKWNIGGRPSPPLKPAGSIARATSRALVGSGRVAHLALEGEERAVEAAELPLAIVSGRKAWVMAARAMAFSCHSQAPDRGRREIFVREVDARDAGIVG